MLREIMSGAAAGLAATVPMTATMKSGFDVLPPGQKYPLPPRQITSRVGHEADAWDDLAEHEKKAITLAAHFSYGAAAGAVYAAVVPPRYRNVTSGAAYGMAVWAGSYLILLPALGILPPATKHPKRRNLLMIGAHLVWGGVLGAALREPKRLPRRPR